MGEVPTREEFLFLPAWQVALFYALIAASVALFVWQVRGRVRLWMRGRPISWRPDYVGGIVRYVLGQKKVKTSRTRSGAPMHLLIFYGFLTLFIGTTLLAVNTYLPWKFHKGAYFLTYEFVLDVMGVALFIGLVWAGLRRLFAKPKSLTSDLSDYATLGLLLLLTVTGFLLEAARMSAAPQPFDTSAPVGHWLSGLIPGVTPQIYIGIWWVHAALVAVFIAAVPRLRLRHIVYAVLCAAGTDPEAKMSSLTPLKLEDVEKTGKIGVEKPEEYSRWHLMSLDACMECGRCTEVCPAHAVGKPLDPQKVVQDIRSALSDGRTVADAVSEEALWACTTCNACVEVCPVLIRHVDLIVDARRHLVAEGRMSGTAATMLRQVQSTESAWGTPAAEREKWMGAEEVPIARDLAARGESFEYLLWVGCAGAVDPAAGKTARSVASLLKKAGVSFACLGIEERCTGDSARRVGDEFLFQQLAEQNVGTLNSYKFKKIVTACPHCFNTLKNEYAPFGGDYEVMHHTQLLSELVESGRLKAPSFEDGAVVFHDPCYLGRINNESDAPRRALGVPSDSDASDTPVGKWLNEPLELEGNRLAEPVNHGRKTLCCGAGGGRMWMDEDISQRPGSRRAQELVETGAKTVAVACPFCRIMLETGLQQVEGGDKTELVDIAEMLSEANEDA
ncbi:MAG: (Fe-S)-binding protein [Armatimonadetes bacterium]|nr:(Fe-S)-binding protein [Armatimonadota bacterium]